MNLDAGAGSFWRIAQRLLVAKDTVPSRSVSRVGLPDSNERVIVRGDSSRRKPVSCVLRRVSPAENPKGGPTKHKQSKRCAGPPFGFEVSHFGGGVLHFAEGIRTLSEALHALAEGIHTLAKAFYILRQVSPAENPKGGPTKHKQSKRCAGPPFGFEVSHFGGRRPTFCGGHSHFGAGVLHFAVGICTLARVFHTLAEAFRIL